MSRKNTPDDYVRMAQSQCIICGALYENGELLIHKHLQSIPKDKTVTGTGMCPEHKKLYDAGYIALIEVDGSKTTAPQGSTLKHSEAYRTGNIMHIKRSAAARVFNQQLPEEVPMVFIDQAAFRMLTDMANAAEKEST